MAQLLTENRVCFGLFELDLRARQLTKNGARIRLPHQPIEVLSLLLERAGEIVTREELRQRLWRSDVFVDFDHGLNKSIQKLRDALGDSASSPRYIETIPKVGYRFIAPVADVGRKAELKPETPAGEPRTVAGGRAGEEARRRGRIWLAVGVCAALAVGGILVERILVERILVERGTRRPPQVRYTQLTDFTDSAVSPAVSPDGRMLAFFRSGEGFLTLDPIYVKMLPAGEAKQLTDDARLKYGLEFSPDGSEIAYTVLEGGVFSTYEVSALGGEPHLLLENAAGLAWLDPERQLFSEARPRSGIHLGVVMANLARAKERDIYFPAHERGMAHASYPSPDRRWALVIEMTGNGQWGPCRLVALEGQSQPRTVGPAAGCTAAGWSPDGTWMYFTAAVEGRSHLWRERFPEGQPEQLTSGPTDEDGLAVESTGALITSVGVHESAIWIHDRSGERQLSSEGEVVGDASPVFSPDGSVLYYLLRRADGTGAELWRTYVATARSEPMFAGTAVSEFDLSPDGRQVVYTTAPADGRMEMWVAPVDGSQPSRRVSVSGARSPHFAMQGLLFQRAEGNQNYVEQSDLDGSHRSRVLPFPIIGLQTVSPDGRWVAVSFASAPPEYRPEIAMVRLNGGGPLPLCRSYCRVKWTMDGRTLLISIEERSTSGPGRTLAIPLSPEGLPPELPPNGIAAEDNPALVKAAEVIARDALVPGRNREQYAWVNTTVHRNLYRIELP